MKNKTPEHEPPIDKNHFDEQRRRYYGGELGDLDGQDISDGEKPVPSRLHPDKAAEYREALPDAYSKIMARVIKVEDVSSEQSVISVSHE